MLAEDTAHNVISIGSETALGCKNVKIVRYKNARSVSKTTHPYLHPYEKAIIRGQAVARILLNMKKQAFYPDIVIAHPGWGESLFVKDIFPRCKLVHFCEYYYHAEGADMGFDPEFGRDPEAAASLRVLNSLHLTNIENCDLAITPTQWQLSLHPQAYRDKIKVIHEGIDTDRMKEGIESKITLPDGKVIEKGQEVVTYVARNLEPYRGFHVFMRSISELLKVRPECQVVVVGGDGVSYGRKPKNGKTWREVMIEELDLDLTRIHFLGNVPHQSYRNVLNVSAVHIYMTYPFVLSWSLLEAMSTGCLIIASNTAPVKEVINNGKNGILVDFFDHIALAKQTAEALENQSLYYGIRRQAMNDAKKYCSTAGTDQYLKLLDLA